MSEHLHMAMTVDKFALLVIFFNGSFFLNCCHVEKMTHISYCVISAAVTFGTTPVAGQQLGGLMGVATPQLGGFGTAAATPQLGLGGFGAGATATPQLGSFGAGVAATPQLGGFGTAAATPQLIAQVIILI